VWKLNQLETIPPSKAECGLQLLPHSNECSTVYTPNNPHHKFNSKSPPPNLTPPTPHPPPLTPHPPRHYRERLLIEFESAVRERAAPLLELCTKHGVPNAKVGGLGVGVAGLGWRGWGGGIGVGVGVGDGVDEKRGAEFIVLLGGGPNGCRPKQLKQARPLNVPLKAHQTGDSSPIHPSAHVTTQCRSSTTRRATGWCGSSGTTWGRWWTWWVDGWMDGWVD